ncbi:TonB-dependent receptor [Aliikangiella maris]|uniref:TonB-dependent receptor n=2 Tax=Aliikangiella maris TaxID=3162458 RepID=A0ABV3MMC6_9GAMM
MINEQRAIADQIIDVPYVKAYRNHDIQVGYQWLESLRTYIGIRNLTDEYPDKVRASLNGFSGRQGYAGRTYYIGFNWQLD